MWTVLPRRACMQESRVHLPVILFFLLFQVHIFWNWKYDMCESLEFKSGLQESRVTAKEGPRLALHLHWQPAQELHLLTAGVQDGRTLVNLFLIWLLEIAGPPLFSYPQLFSSLKLCWSLSLFLVLSIDISKISNIKYKSNIKYQISNISAQPTPALPIFSPTLFLRSQIVQTMVSAASTGVQTGAWRVQARVNFHLNYFEDFELHHYSAEPEGASAQIQPVEEPSEPKGYSYPVPGSKHIFYQMNPDIKVISHIEDWTNESIN